MKIIHKNCDKSLSKDKKLPLDSYLVEYNSDGNIQYDIVQASSKVEIFDYYYDTYGKNGIKSFKWTDGTVSSKFYGYSIKEEKKKKR
jgi:hypothetical protein